MLGDVDCGPLFYPSPLTSSDDEGPAAAPACRRTSSGLHGPAPGRICSSPPTRGVCSPPAVVLVGSEAEPEAKPETFAYRRDSAVAAHVAAERLADGEIDAADGAVVQLVHPSSDDGPTP